MAKRKQISKHTSACPPLLPPPLMAADLGSLGDSLAPGLSQAEPKPYGSGAEAQGRLGARSEGDRLGPHPWLWAVSRGWSENRGRSAAPSLVRRDHGDGRGEGPKP